MINKQLPLVVDFAAEEGRLPLPLKIALGDNLVEVVGAGTKVPVRREIEISNAADDQEQMTIRVVQGASMRPAANAPVGSYVIGGITPAPRGTLSIRLVLEVTASLGFNLSADENGKEYEVDMQEPGKALGQKAIAALMDEEDKDPVPPFDGTYDRAAFHEQSVADEGLDAVQSYVHTGMFLGWMADKKLLSESFQESAQALLKKFLAREVSAATLYQECGGVFHEDMLSPVGNAFAREYFDFRRGRYLADYEHVLAPQGATLLAVEDNQQNFLTLSERLNLRLAEWQDKQD